MTSWSLAAPTRWIEVELRNLVYEFRGFRAEFKDLYDSAVAHQMEKLQKLDDLNPFDKSRICIAVEDAARCVFATSWIQFFSAAVENRTRMKVAIGVMAAPLVIGLLYLLPWRSLPHQHVLLAFSLPLMFPIADIGSYLHSRIPYRYVAVTQLIEAVAAFTAVATFKMWYLYTRSAWKVAVSRLPLVHPKLRMQIASLPAAQILQCALLVVGIVCTIAISWRLVNLCGRLVVTRKEGRYSQPAIQCAEIIITLLHVSFVISELTTPLRDASDDIEAYSSRRSQITTPSWNAIRNYVDAELGWLAYHIRRRWQEAMRSSYGPAGELIAGNAARIELFARLQQARNMLLSSNLFELKDVLASTLVQAADGNWHLIGAEEEEYADKVRTQRRAKIIRRAIAIAVPIAVAIAAPHFMRHYPALYPSIVIMCVAFSVGQLALLLDSNALTALDIGGKFTNILKRGGLG